MIPFRTKKIGRNELCPCGSKKKYKNCHGGINAPSLQNPGQLDAQIKNLSPRSECLAPDELREKCQGKAISSHTVSRSGSLGMIARNSHVYSFKTSIKKINEANGLISPQLTGWKAASTFPGFCAHHDKEIFEPLEDAPFSGSLQQCFLLSYRAIVWEYYAKLRADHSSPLRVALAASKDNYTQSLASFFNFQNELGLRDMQARKKYFDDALFNENWDHLHGLLIEFDGLFPIQCSAAWSPTIDVFGKHLQTLGNSPQTPSGATMSSFAADGKSYFLLSWMDDGLPIAPALADSIEAISNDEKPNVIGALLLLTSENCHISPDWYDSLSQDGKKWVNTLAHPITLPGMTAAKAGGAGHISSISVNSVMRF